MKTTLPALPLKGSAISLAVIEDIEAHVAKEVMLQDDIKSLREWQAQAAALEAYLRGKELHAPMMGAQRRVEARIGQLLGNGAGHGPGRGKKSPSLDSFPLGRQTIGRFRILARGFDCLNGDEWRSPRQPLMQLIQQRIPSPRHVPTGVRKDGRRKPYAERIAEIKKLMDEGYQAEQIAERTSISVDTVQMLVRKSGLSFRTHKHAKVKLTRIVEQTITVLEGVSIGVRVVTGASIAPDDAKRWADAMDAPLKNLIRFHNLLVRLSK